MLWQAKACLPRHRLALDSIHEGLSTWPCCKVAPHDFAVTNTWYVMIQNALKMKPLEYLAAGPLFNST